MAWRIEYDNQGNGGFVEWWNVTDGDKCFRSYDEDLAKWLCDLLNKQEGE